MALALMESKDANLKPLMPQCELNKITVAIVGYKSLAATTH